MQAQMDRGTITRDTPLEKLTLDSMDFVEVIFELEERLDTSIPYNASDVDFTGKTVGAVVDMVEQAVGKSAPSP